MSAFVVSNAHIDTLVTAAIKADLIKKEEADAFGRLLLQENVRSVMFRYQVSARSKEGREYRRRIADYRWYGREPASDAELYMACECYGYQSCEHPEWWLSAARFAQEFLFARVQHVPHHERTYERVGWGIND